MSIENFDKETFLSWIFGCNLSRKKLTEKTTKYYGKEGLEFLKSLWKDKRLYVSGWGDVRLTKKGYDLFYSLRNTNYLSIIIEGESKQ